MQRRAVLFGACVALLAACGGGGETADPTTTTSTTSTSTTTTSTTTTTTEAPVELSPEDEVRQAFVRIVEMRNALFRNPDPDQVEDYYDPGCACFELDRQQFSNLRNLGWSVGGDVDFAILTGVEFGGFPEQNPNLADLIAVFDSPPEVDFVDDSGEVQQRFTNDGPDSGAFTLVRSESGWRVLGIAPLDLNQQRLEEVRDEGLPG